MYISNILEDISSRNISPVDISFVIDFDVVASAQKEDNKFKYFLQNNASLQVTEIYVQSSGNLTTSYSQNISHENRYSTSCI